MKLIDACENKNYIVTEIDKSDSSALKKICSIGILPGLKLKILQKKPMIIFEVFNSSFAVDNELATKIIVKEID
ncbi:FeoA family protein [Deferribacter thermophilus]|uniref:FeoA family protein n=1 Tax=Deferribacter thermophilus TaxID=53573 RepID=UPI003C16A7CC